MAGQFSIGNISQVRDVYDGGEGSNLSNPNVEDEGLGLHAEVLLSFAGDLPEGKRVLNDAVLKWVDDHRKELDDAILPMLKDFLEDHHQELDISDLTGEGVELADPDQVDYLAELDVKTGKLSIIVEVGHMVDKV
jgi:hypothetical protein